MKPPIDTADHAFLQTLRRHGPSTIAELCDVLQVTATAVRQRLSRLQTAGLIGREMVRAGRGRPFHRYLVTETGLQLLGDNYRELALLLWEAVHESLDATARERVLTSVAQGMASRYGSAVQSAELSTRINELQVVLTGRGFDVEVGAAGSLPILRENNCPYHELAMSDRGICELEHRVFEQVIGAPLELRNCARDGDRCCEFQVSQSLTPVLAQVDG